MERFDIVVTGLDPGRPRSFVIAAIARRLVRSAAEIEQLVDTAPSTLVPALTEEDAQRIVSDLRALGARVKPQTQAAELPDPEAPPPKIELLYWSADEDGYDRPNKQPDPPPEAPKSAPPPPEPEAPPPETPTPIVVHPADGFALTAAIATAPIVVDPGAPPLDEVLRPPSPARFGRAATDARQTLGPTRVFFPALRDVFSLPLRGATRRSFALAPALAVLAIVLAALGLRSTLELGPLLLAFAVAAASGFVGLVLQVTSSCLAATSIGERVPAPLPGRLMEDYLRPGGGVFLAIIVLAMLTGETAVVLMSMRATALTLGLLWSVAAIYGATGFVLSAANGSARGFIDVPRLIVVVARAPLHALVTIVLTAVFLGGSGVGLAWLVVLATQASSLATLGLFVSLGALVSLASSYAAGVSGAVLGQLLYASA